MHETRYELQIDEAEGGGGGNIGDGGIGGRTSSSLLDRGPRPTLGAFKFNEITRDTSRGELSRAAAKLQRGCSYPLLNYAD